MRWLVANNRLPTNCKVLDFGCGQGFDAYYYDMEMYDPHYYPDKPEGRYNIITCHYVLNVIPGCLDRRSVLTIIDSLLVKNGHAYITVRADKKALIGTTKQGTWQGLIELSLDIVRTTPYYHIYRMWKGQSNCTITATTNQEKVQNTLVGDLTNQASELCLK